MTGAQDKKAQGLRGGASVGFITDMNGIESASVIYLRLWSDGPAAQASVRSDFATSLATDVGHALMRMKLTAPKDMGRGAPSTHSPPTTVH